MGILSPKNGPKCEECPLYESGIPVNDFVPRDFSGLTLVGEMPGRNEVKFQSCFIGQSGDLLDGALAANSLTRDQLHITNCIRCGLPQGAKPDDKKQKGAANCCRPLLFNNLDFYETKVVCALGAVPWESMTGLSGIDKYRGCVIPASKDVPWHTTGTLHPAGLIRVEARRIRADLLIDDLYKAWRLAQGKVELWDPVVRDPNDFDDLIEFLRMKSGDKSCDVETDGIDALTCNLATIGIAGYNQKTRETEGWSIPFHPKFNGFYTDSQWEEIVFELKRILTDTDQIIVFHNMSYDIPVLERELDIDITADCHDTLLLHHATYPKLPHDLQGVTAQYLCIEPWKSQFRASEKDLNSISKLLDKGKTVYVDFGQGLFEEVEEEEVTITDDRQILLKSPSDLNEIEVGELLWYNSCDCLATLEVFYSITEEAHQQDTYRVYEEDRQLVRHTIDWYYAGVAIDETKRAKLEVEYSKELDKLKTEIQKLCNLTGLATIEAQVSIEKEKLDEAINEIKTIRTHCAFCDYESKSGPDQCRHVIQFHYDKAEAIADSQSIAYKKKNPKDQKEVLLKSVKKWLKDDLDAAQSVAKSLRARIKEIKKTPCAETFNPGSPIQLRAALKARGLTPSKLTKKSGELSTSKDALWELRDDPFVDLLFRYREKAKLYSTYIVALPNKLGPDGRYHPVWKLHSTPSGRFGTSPAIQNWPKSMKELIVPDTGNVIIGADYAALELRISALLSGQQDLIDSFITNADIHARHAGIFFPNVWPDVNRRWLESADNDPDRNERVPERDKLRGRGKNVTFGKIYRAGPQILYEQIRERLDEVRTPAEHRQLKREVAAMSAALDITYPNIPKWAEYVHRIAEQMLSLRTELSGRIRKWPMGQVPPTEAANHPIQGLAADIMNRATLKLIKALKDRGLYCSGAWIIMQIHDAIYLEVMEEYALTVAKLIEDCMYTELMIKSVVTGKDHTMIFPAEAEIGYNAQQLMSKQVWETKYSRERKQNGGM